MVFQRHLKLDYDRGCNILKDKIVIRIKLVFRFVLMRLLFPGAGVFFISEKVVSSRVFDNSP